MASEVASHSCAKYLRAASNNHEQKHSVYKEQAHNTRLIAHSRSLVQECDATKVAQSDAAGPIKNFYVVDSRNTFILIA